MIFEGPSRAAAVRALAAEFQAPLDWDALLDIGRALAPRLPALDREPAEPPAGLRARLIAASPAVTDPPQPALAARAAIRAMALLLDACTLGAIAALARTLDEVSALPDAAAILTALGRFLDATGIARDLAPDELEALSARLSLAADRIDVLQAALGLLGLARTAAYPARRNAFHHAAAPRLRAAADVGQVDAMLAIESLAYDAYLKTVETPAHHTETLGTIEDAYDRLPAEAWPPPPAGRDRPRVAFLIFNGAMLAHTEVLLTFLAGLGQIDAPVEPVVFVYGSAGGGELGRRLDAMGVRWEAVGPAGPRVTEAHYRRVAARLAAAQVDAAVFVSLPLHLAYFCRRPLAPVQVWWSLKFPLPNFDRLDGRVFYRSLFDRSLQIEGRLWRGGPLAITPPPRPDPAAVQAIRARFPGKTILGTVAREEKVANPEYLAAVAGVLQRHPDTCFLWTGRSQPPEVQDAFDRAGVAGRCHFVGWVDPAPYLMAFDLFVETYPLTGIMCAWAMAFGRPVIPVGGLGVMGAYLDPVLSGALPVPAADLARIEAIFAPVRARLPGLFARDPGQIGAFADALLADPELRRALGAAQQAFIAAFMADEASSAAIQARHFADIVRETRAAVSAGTRAPPR